MDISKWNGNVVSIASSFLIGGLVFLGYWTTFLYEYGYLNYFHAPVELVEVSMPRLFFVVLVFSIIPMGIYHYWSLMVEYKSNGRSYNFIFTAALFAAYISNSIIWDGWWSDFFSGLLIVIIVSPYVLWKFNGYLDRRYGVVRREGSGAYLDLKNWAGVVLLFILYSSAIFSFGMKDASSAQKFWVAGNHDVAIRMYSTGVVVGEYDENGKMGRVFKYMDMKEFSGGGIELKKIGKLKVVGRQEN
ncbi:hypothetical protein [Pseudomonas citronellolis]|uniref:hypothetical protein n=1 Tax=Pseudomonas citronellolis TaxID=53408 RepID=UPI00248DFB7E|nr:hypothetical protein [Pseudomonas citronellolis]